MDDREIVAAIVAGDLPGLAAAYDEHAESLYGYCRWMLREPEDAADAVEDTFMISAGPGCTRSPATSATAGCARLRSVSARTRACLSHPAPPTSGDAPSRPNWPGSSVPPWTS